MPRPIDVTKVPSFAQKRRDVGKFLEGHDELTSWIADVAFPDGSPVPEVQLSIRPRGLGWLVQLKIGGPNPMRVQCEEMCLEHAFLALEHLLSSPSGGWEPDPYPLGGTGRKRK